MNDAAARIVWLAPEEGGRQIPPAGPSYSTPARFEDAVDQWNAGEAWSLLIERVAQSSDSRQWWARVSFLAPDAPLDLLSEGSCFALYEGKKRVAEGTIVPPAAMPTSTAAAAVATPQNSRS